MNSSLTIWCNAHYPEAAMNELRQGIGRHKLIQPDADGFKSGGGFGRPAAGGGGCYAGQPDAEQIAVLPRLKWVHPTTAGYTRYDNDVVCRLKIPRARS